MGKLGMLILAIAAFVSGLLVSVQWMGTKHGLSFYNLFEKPAVVEKVLEIEVVKILVISDDQKIQMINQEYRDALLKISAIPYTPGKLKAAHESIRQYATKALSVPEVIAKQ